MLERGVRGVENGVHADGDCGFDVFAAVIDEKDVGWRGVETFGSVKIDGGFGFGEVYRVRPGMVGEVVDPAMAGAEAGLHWAGHIGEDAGGDSGVLKVECPGEHRRVDGGPVVDVGGDERGELIGCEDGMGGSSGLVPEVFGGEIAAVVGVTMGPVAAMKLFFGETAECTHTIPGGGIGWAGEDHSVVEEDCFYLSHA